MFTIEKAYAKINLMLDVVKKKEDGFHDILTIMQVVDLYDNVHISLNDTGKIKVVVENCDIDIPMEKNLAYIAAQKFMDKLYFDTHAGVEIVIEKHIPIAAGLGGGSADAGAVLRGLNFLFGKPFTKEELCEIGLSVGSDVPFCIIGGVQICEGRGEVKHSIDGIMHYHLVIACGEEKISTAEQYRLLDEKFNNFSDHKLSAGCPVIANALLARRCTDAFKEMYNIFESLYDESSSVAKIKKIMYECDARFAMLSGSGPSVYAVVYDSIYAEDLQEALAKEGIKSYICRPINTEYEYLDPHVDAWKQ